MNQRSSKIAAVVLLVQLALSSAWAADETIATAVYARIGNGYQREKLKDGSFKPEFYALANGGRIAGTTSDITVDRVTYPEVAEIATKLLAGQKYHYAQKAEQATLLLMLQWGSTIGIDRESSGKHIGNAGQALTDLNLFLQEHGLSRTGPPVGSTPPSTVLTEEQLAMRHEFEASYESGLMQLLMDNRVRDRLNEHNAKVLGYLDDMNEADGIQRWAGGGDRFNDLTTDIEEVRYYIVVTAYDFAELVKHNKRKVLWVTKVSVRSPGNSFTDSYAAMLKGASKYFGQDSGKLIRGEESKGTVELGELKFLGEAKEPAKPTETRK